MELDAASNNSVEHIRTLVEQVRFQPQQGKYKIFIIDEVHMLSQAAFNAFLKTLEEPPPYAIFILATTEKHKIIPTILSRCQIFDFKRIQVKSMVGHLRNICQDESIEAEEEALHIIAQKADGALRDALSIFDRIVSFSGKNIVYEDVITNLNILDYDYYFKLTEALLATDLRQVLLIFDKITRSGFEGDIFINELAAHLRNLLVCKDKETVRLLEVSDALKKRYHQQAILAPSSFLLTALNLANDCDINYKMARNKNLHVEMTLIKMCHITQAVQLAISPPQPSASVEKKKPDVNGAVTGNNLNGNIKSQKEGPIADKVVEKKKEPTIVEKKPVEEENNLAEKEVVEIEKPSPEENLQKEQNALSNTEKVIPANKKESLNLSAYTTSSLPKLKSLDSLHAEVVEDEENEVLHEAKLTPTDLDKAWRTYIEGTEKDSVRAMLKGAEVNIVGEQVTVIVGSALAESTIRQERSLREFLRESLHAPMLAMKIKLDPSRSNAAPVKPKKLTDSEKYWRMKTINPLVDEVRKRFDLKLENE